VTARFVIPYVPCDGSPSVGGAASLAPRAGEAPSELRLPSAACGSGSSCLSQVDEISPRFASSPAALSPLPPPPELPQVPVPPATVPEPMPEPELRRLLVVDDEEFIRYVTVLAFEGQCAGCQVVEAENGEEGIAVFLAQRQDEPPEFDVIIMDIQMPVLTGDLAVKRMRTLERQNSWPRTCIIARSANTTESDQALYRACDMDGCIPKCGNVAQQVLEVLALKQQRPAEFVALD